MCFDRLGELSRGVLVSLYMWRLLLRSVLVVGCLVGIEKLEGCVGIVLLDWVNSDCCGVLLCYDKWYVYCDDIEWN